MKNNKSIKSRIWVAGGHEWEINLRPNYSWAGNHHAITLYLVLVSETAGSEVGAKLSCRLVDPTGRLSPGQEKSVSHNFTYSGCSSVLIVLMGRQELEVSGYLKDDSYTVECVITVIRKVPLEEAVANNEHRRPDAALRSTDLHRHLGELRRNGTGADVTFVVRGESFPAHRAMLASRSPVFMAELFGGIEEEALKLIEIKDMEPWRSRCFSTSSTPKRRRSWMETRTKLLRSWRSMCL
ncbi:hypothetical protein QOZ80_UnG0722890 [Eleusine coracana subsp. coracana]|uniref:Uncharacterized protein n=1 Tax=Eleusine coracana subsp. coracana TaxID=191504 RepID=A0AAV9G2C1_ELECO|nr:hypothetical protein QOZ80_UnG0722890 [Eleusine coracana subsp. coracana]